MKKDKKKYRSTPPGFTKKKGPKGRWVFAPSEDTRKLHELMIGVLVDMFGNITFPQTKEVIAPHIIAGNRFYFKLDIEDAFGSINQSDIEEVLEYEFHPNIAKYFFHEEGGLIQGAPASPTLFQLYCQHTIDYALNTICNENNIAYTRYVDDILFSKKKRFVQYQRRALRKLIEDFGFRINNDKTKLVDIKLQKIVFVGVEMHHNSLDVSPKFREKMREELANPKITRAQKDGLLAWAMRVYGMESLFTERDILSLSGGRESARL